MQIKTTEGDREVASKGVAGTALGLGIAGTVGLLNQLSGAGWGGGFLGNRGICPTGAAVGLADAVATTDTREIGKLESKIAKLESERYTDGVGIELYKEIVAKSNANDAKIQANYVELAKAVAALDKSVAVNNQATTDNFAKETGRAVHFAVNGKHLDEEMMEEAFTTITRYDGARAPFWTIHDFEELLSKNNISITGQQYNKYDVNFLAQYYAADFKSLGQDPMTFICMAIDRLHDVDDPKAAEKAYKVASHRIATKH